MISGDGWADRSVVGSWVIPTADGNYGVPPATVIETFWAYKKRACNTCHGDKKVSYGGELGWTQVCPECCGAGKIVVRDDNDMVLMYKIVDPETFSFIPFPDDETGTIKSVQGVVAKEVTAEMVGSWMNTKFHPHFM